MCKWILFAVLLGFCILFAVLGSCILFGEAVRQLLLCFVPRLIARRRLKRFVLSGKNVRVVCFGDPEKGEDSGFHLVFDAAFHGKPRLDTLVFSEIEPSGARKMLAGFCGRTAEAYCYHGGRGLQLIGTLEQGDKQLCLAVHKIKLSGRQKELVIRRKKN